MDLRIPGRGNGAGFTLRDLATPLFRRKLVLVITFAVVFAAAALLGLRLWHTYEAHMSILICDARPVPIVATEADSQTGATLTLNHQELNSEQELLQSRDLLEQVVLENGMQNTHNAFLNLLHPGQTESDRRARAVQALGNELEVENPYNTNQIEIRYRSTDPVRAYDVLASLSKLYLRKHASFGQPSLSNQVVARQTQDNQAALEDAEAGLRVFGETRHDSAANQQRPDPVAQSTAVENDQHTIDPPIAVNNPPIAVINPLIAADALLRESDQKQSNGTPQGSATTQDAQQAHLLLETLAVSLLAAEAKRTQLLQKYEPGHPLVKAANRQVDAVKEAMADANRARDEADLADQRAALAASQRGVDKLKAQIARQGSQSLDEVDLQREAKAAEQNYLQYLSNREQARGSGPVDGSQIENVTIAVPPAIPVLPAHGRGLILLLAFALAALVSFPTAYIIDYFDPSFHSPAQVIDILGIPVVVAVPKRIA